MIHTNHQNPKGEEGVVKNKNELKFSIPEVKKYCLKELILIRDEAEDILDRALKKGMNLETFADYVLDLLDARIERLTSTGEDS